MKFSFFTAENKNLCILHGQVFVNSMYFPHTTIAAQHPTPLRNVIYRFFFFFGVKKSKILLESV